MSRMRKLFTVIAMVSLMVVLTTASISATFLWCPSSTHVRMVVVDVARPASQ
jgi:hypothetical protein